MPTTTIALVRRAEQIRTLVAGLHPAGFTTDAISVVYPQTTSTQPDVTLPDDIAEANAQSGESAAVGAVAGGVMGTALAWMTGGGLVAIPGMGAILAVGPIFTILTGIGVGASLGGITGALIGMGVREVDAKRFTSSISDGRVLIAVRSDDLDDARVAAVLMKHSGGEDIDVFESQERHPVLASAAR